MQSARHHKFSYDVLHQDCLVRVKGEQVAKRFGMKLMRNGIADFRRDVSSKGRPWIDFKIEVRSRTHYARLSNIVASMEDVEFVGKL